MKVEIAYSGVNEKYLEGIKKNLRQKDAVFIRLPSEDYQPLLAGFTKDALIIGEEIPNPIRLAQEAYAFDNTLSILIISEPAHYKELRQELMFTPFIGSSVNCVSDGDDRTLAGKLEDLIDKTRQRRNYQAIKKAPIAVRVPHGIEQLKNEYINQFFEKAPVGAILLDKDSLVLGLNHHASIVMNTDETALLGNTLYHFFPPEVQQQLKEFLDVGYKQRPKQSFLKSTDPEGHIEITVSDISSRTEAAYKIAIVEDITEKVIKDRRIQEQLQELKKINSDLDNFIYTASHDLKSPVSNIEGLIYALKDLKMDDQDEEQNQILEMIEKSILRFKETIQDLSDIAKIQRNIEEDVDIIDIRDAVGSVLSSLENEILVTGTRIVLDMHYCSPLRISRANFRSIVYNLVSNAIKYRSPQRAPVIDLSCKTVGEEVLIEVRDNGLGISDQHRRKMFSMFKRFHDHVEGTGIGLYIVKRILDNSGGRIEVESEVDKGTTFRVYLPGLVDGERQ